MYCNAYYMYMYIHVPSTLAIGVETINKQTQQTNKQNSLNTATKGLENIKAAHVHVHCI